MSDAHLDDFVLDCRALFGDDLVSVFLYGSAAGEDFIPGVSDYNLGVVLRSVRPEHLRRAALKVPRWRRRRIGAPLFLDPAFIRQSLDVFPIEFTEMTEAHRVLYGPDPFAGLTVGLRNLRHQCEFEVRGKLLALRTAYLRAATEIPYGHHERWDGTGYPRGLKGEQIPLAARIFAIADVWDGLCSDRPYRSRWPEETVLEHLRAEAGRQFDPRLVELFLTVAPPGTHALLATHTSGAATPATG